MFIKRFVLKQIENDLKKKMVLLAGPRQCGKTSLAHQLLKNTKGAYYNWDVNEHRRQIRDGHLNADAKLWVLDELHKYRDWRNYLKGIFDLKHKQHQILVTGSARLQVYSRGGDSLQGRYYLHRLHPLTLSEVTGQTKKESPLSFTDIPYKNKKSAQKTLEDLLTLGGFPEPFTSSSEKEANRWRINYRSQIVREDINTLENIRDLDRLELLFDRLGHVVGSPLSINALRKDLEVAFETVKHWLSILENVYGCFRVSPYGGPKIKAVKKEQKLYLWDWAAVEEPGSRIENLVAVHLLRFVHWCRDIEGEKIELRYFRSRVGHEVDFILLKKGEPWVAIEVKSKEKKIDKGLKYFLEREKCPYAFQISLSCKGHYSLKPINDAEIHIMPISQFLLQLM